MSTSATRWAWQQGVKGPDKAVLLCLAWRAQADGTVRVSIAGIADDCGISPRAARYAIKSLIELGLIEAERKHKQVSSYDLLGAPRAPGTTGVLQGAPRASNDTFRKAIAEAKQQGIRIGYRLAERDQRRRAKLPVD